MLFTIGLIIFVGMLAQWISWIIKIPVIISLLLGGLIVGPFLGILSPKEFMSQELILTVVELCVSLILFDGSMQLKFSEFKGAVASGLQRILSLGLLIHFILIASAAYFLVGNSLGVAGILAGILIVTGPTVVIPALREANLNKQTGRYLKWEGIITDPIGAIIAIIIYDAMILSSLDSAFMVLLAILKIIFIALGFSLLLRQFVVFTFEKKFLPEYLQLPFITCVVISSFVFSNEIQHGSGLLTVTILGMLIGNSKIDILYKIREFKESITTLCISFVFIIITANTSFEAFQMITINQIIFILLVSFVLRPIAILFATIKSQMKFSEKILIGAFAPRGIVAVSVAAALSTEMSRAGFIEIGNTVFPIVLLIVITTVVGHSTYLKFLSRKLNLESQEGKGVIIIGTMPWVIDLSLKLMELGIPVLVTSASWYKLAPFRKRGIETFYGQILSHLEMETLDLADYSYLLGMSENNAFNSLCCEKFAKYLGHDHVFKLKQAKNNVHDQYNIDKSTYCVFINDLDLKFENLIKYHQYGWSFKYTCITKNYTYQDFILDNEKSIVCIKVSEKKEIQFGSRFEQEPIEGDILISFSAKYEEQFVQGSGELMLKSS